MKRTSLASLALAISISACSSPTGLASSGAQRSTLPPGSGARAPEWLRDAETFAVDTDGSSWAKLAGSRVAFVSHCPISRDYFAAAHRAGIRVVPYVTPYQLRADRPYQGIDVQEHLDMIEIDDSGGLRRSKFWTSADEKNAYAACPASPAYRQALLRWVEHVMDLGADGVFVDNLFERQRCYGSVLHRHQHVVEDANEAYASLLAEIARLVKARRPDAAILGNSADPSLLSPSYWRALDSDMFESFLFSWERRADARPSTESWWTKTQAVRPWLAEGKAIEALSSVAPRTEQTKANAFFSYAAARIAGYAWNAGLPVDDPDAGILYHVRLGPATSDLRSDNGLFVREFANGFVALNTTERPMALAAPLRARGHAIWDLAVDRPASWDLSAHAAVARRGGRGGSRGLCLTAGVGDREYATQTLHPDAGAGSLLTIRASSNSVNVTNGGVEADYSIFADLTFEDGSHEFGRQAGFSPGTHGWEERAIDVRLSKRLRSLTLNLLLRKPGHACFDDVVARVDSASDWAANGTFETLKEDGAPLAVPLSGGAVDIPAASGRVFLYGPGRDDEFFPAGPSITIVTDPPTPNAVFGIDGWPMWTQAGPMAAELARGDGYGRLRVTFRKGGRHRLEFLRVDGPPPPATSPIRFEGWVGSSTRSSTPTLDIDVSGETVVIARLIPGQ